MQTNQHQQLGHASDDSKKFEPHITHLSTARYGRSADAIPHRRNFAQEY
ncbi:hypothetical protein [Burkholderia pseudomallei]|nr:hypothetical protein [Burkholderia pseudomallei]MBF3845297.1 hypothetical protein [Burkholderia pseudomallei]MDS1024066.1 hypothetical protein [Burkholderia pseudomallei]